MKTFKLTVGDESAQVELPDGATLTQVVDMLLSQGCNLTPAPNEFAEGLLPSVRQQHDELGMSYSEWFRTFVSDW